MGEVAFFQEIDYHFLYFVWGSLLDHACLGRLPLSPHLSCSFSPLFPSITVITLNGNVISFVQAVLAIDASSEIKFWYMPSTFNIGVLFEVALYLTLCIFLERFFKGDLKKKTSFTNRMVFFTFKHIDLT